MPAALDRLLAGYAPEVRALVEAARARVREVMPNVEETVDAKSRVIGFGYGSGYKGVACTLILGKTGVKLGVVGGASLPDPKGLLEGSGKVHRYVVLSRPSDLQRPGLGPLLRAAHAAALARFGRG